MSGPSHRQLLNYSRDWFIAAGAIAPYRFVGVDLLQAVSSANLLGVSECTIEIGECFNVAVAGTTPVEAAGIIPAGSRVDVDADGKVVAAAAGTAGRAMGAAAFDGDVIEVLLADLTQS